MKAPEVLIQELMQRVRTVLYKGKPDQVWYSQQQMIKKALLHPAAWLEERKVEIPAERYKTIMEGILDAIAANGNLSQVTWVSRYVLHCFQQHMEHHGDEYYQEGKVMRNRVSVFMTALGKVNHGADLTVPVLAQAEQLLKIGKRKAKVKPVAQEPDLFGRK